MFLIAKCKSDVYLWYLYSFTPWLSFPPR